MLSDKPQNLNEHDWYYEEPFGFQVFHEVIDKNGAWLRTDNIKIPWRKVLASVKRYQAEKTTKKGSRHA